MSDEALTHYLLECQLLQYIRGKYMYLNQINDLISELSELQNKRYAYCCHNTNDSGLP